MGFISYASKIITYQDFIGHLNCDNNLVLYWKLNLRDLDEAVAILLF